jgi:hypothetical protein
MLKHNNQAGLFISLTPEQFAEKYRNNLGRVRGGTLCFWGHWFGRPYDNFHQIIAVDFDASKNILTLHFSGREILIVNNPSDIQEYDNKLQIAQADKVYWQWYYYGKVQEEENMFYYELIKNDDTITGVTNANWYKPDWNGLTSNKPAILLA